MLIGDERPDNSAGRMSMSILFLVFLTPWILMGVGSAVVGLLALGPRKEDLAELWICLPAGAAVLLLVGAVLYSFFWRTPRLTVLHFELDGSTLTYVTRRNGVESCAISEFRSVVEERGPARLRFVGMVAEGSE